MSHTTESPDHDHHAFISSAKLIAGCALVSMTLGAARDVLMAKYLGAGMVASALLTAWTIPNLFRRLFGEGAVSSAMVPAFTSSLHTRSDGETQRLFSVTFTVLLLVLAAVTLVVEGAVAGVLRWGEPGEATRLLLEYLAVLMPYMVLICLTAFFMAVLNAHRHFFAPAFMPVILNVVWIAALVLVGWLGLSRTSSGRWLVVAILVGGVLQLLFQVPFAWRRGVRLRLSLAVHDPDFRQIVRLWIPVIIGSAVIQINALVDRGLAFLVVPHEGSAAVLFYGNRLMHFPISLIAVAISTAVLPTLSTHAVTHETEKFKRTLMSALRMTLFLAIPAGIGLMVLASPVVEVIYRHGAFMKTDATVQTLWDRVVGIAPAVRTTWVVLCYTAGVWAQTGVFILLRAFYALKDTRTTVYVASVMVLFNLALNLTLIWFMDEAGLALSTSVAGVLQFVVLSMLLRRRLGPLGGREAWRTSVKTLAVSLVMGVLVLAAWYRFWPVDAGIWVRAGVLVTLIVAATGVFVLGATVLKMSELGQLLRRRRGRRE
ncbi:MAG TPA: murein biosynthesis integral membrane protein MurJ [Planctomycetota bacterium]|nr:murein biosynthesis integral membrane protein MurJ [Planctomycetota bacterium]